MTKEKKTSLEFSLEPIALKDINTKRDLIFFEETFEPDDINILHQPPFDSLFDETDTLSMSISEELAHTIIGIIATEQAFSSLRKELENPKAVRENVLAYLTEAHKTLISKLKLCKHEYENEKDPEDQPFPEIPNDDIVINTMLKIGGLFLDYPLLLRYLKSHKNGYFVNGYFTEDIDSSMILTYRSWITHPQQKDRINFLQGYDPKLWDVGITTVDMGYSRRLITPQGIGGKSRANKYWRIVTQSDALN